MELGITQVSARIERKRFNSLLLGEIERDLDANRTVKFVIVDKGRKPHRGRSDPGAFAVWHGPAVRPEKFPRTTPLGRAQFRTPPRTTTLHK